MTEPVEVGVDVPRNTEQQRNQVDAAVRFAGYLTARYPQVDQAVENPQLNYYLAGSLATTLLARAETIELCDETTGSDIAVGRSLINPFETRAALERFARPIGDIDFVPTGHYEDLQKGVQDSYKEVGADAYQQARAKYLWRGSGGPMFDDVPADALAALHRAEGQQSVLCDSASVYGTHKFARIQAGGQEYYIARPDTIIGYKILHMLQMFDQKSDKFNKDFAHLHEAMTKLYSDDELVQVTHQILGEYDDALKQYGPTGLPQMTKRLLANPDVGPEIRGFMGKVVSYDQSQNHLLGNQAG